MEVDGEEEEEEQQQGEELICDVRNARLFAQLAASLLPHGAGGAGTSSSSSLLFDWGNDEGGRRAAAAAGRSNDASSTCLYVQRRKRDLLLRSASSSRDVYTELRLPASFFLSVEHRPRRHTSHAHSSSSNSSSSNSSSDSSSINSSRDSRDSSSSSSGRQQWHDGGYTGEENSVVGATAVAAGAAARAAGTAATPRRGADAAAGRAARRSLTERDDRGRDAEEEEDEEEEEETAEVMVPARELLSALMLLGEGTFLRLRFAFDEGLLCLLLHEGGSSSSVEQHAFRSAASSALCEGEALSEIVIKTFLVTEQERLPNFDDLRAAAMRQRDTSSRDDISTAPPESLRMSPLIFREVLVDLLLATAEEDSTTAASSGTELLLCASPPRSSLSPPADTTAAGGRGQRYRQQPSYRNPSEAAEENEEFKEPLLRISTRQASLSQQIDLGMHPQLFSWVALTRPHKHRYKLKSFISTVPALKLAQGLRLQWLEDGLLLLQFLIKPAARTRLFLHVHICPLAAAAET